MTRFLALLISSILLAGCASAPVTLVVTDRTTGEPIEGMHLMAYHPMFALFLPKIEKGRTDANGELTLQLKAHKQKGPYLKLYSTTESGFGADLSTTSDFVRRASRWFKDTGEPLRLPIRIDRYSPSVPEPILIELPADYVGPVGVVVRRVPHDESGIERIVRVNIETDGRMITLMESSRHLRCDLEYVIRRKYGTLMPPQAFPAENSKNVQLFSVRSFMMGGAIEIAPGVLHHGIAQSYVHRLYFVGTETQYRQYRKQHLGSQYQVNNDEFERMLGVSLKVLQAESAPQASP